MLITIDNVKEVQDQLGRSVVVRSRFIDPNSKSIKYILLQELTIALTNGDVITIPKGFIWDLSSVPRWMWGVFPPDGDFELATLIHDFLYVNKLYTRKFCDVEMFTWSKAVAGTLHRNSWADYDNWGRYAGVRLFGWIVWYDLININ